MLTDIRALVDPFLCALTNVNNNEGRAIVLILVLQDLHRTTI
jgi:hypothetical protein